MYNTMSVGRKYDQGKTPWHLLLSGPIAKAVAEVVRVIQFGAAKYEPDNWQLVVNARTRYFDACIRHLVAWRSGESVDAETGISHLAHSGCNILFLLSFDLGLPEQKPRPPLETPDMSVKGDPNYIGPV